MMGQYKNRKTILALVVLIVMGICAAAVCFADEAGDTSALEATPRIKDIPGTNSEGEGDRDFTGEAGSYYDFTGTVTDVQKDGIVVGDSYMRIAPNAKISGAGPGAYVGITFNKNGEVVECERIKKPRR